MLATSDLGSVFLACGIGITLLALTQIYFAQYRSPLPPGPRRLPLVGNIHQLPMKYQERTFAEWGKAFGDLVYSKFFNQPVLVINHSHIARELLDKRSTKYSGRPRFIYVREIAQWDPVVLMPYGEKWRQHRRWFQRCLIVRNKLDTYESLQEEKVALLLKTMLNSPDHALSHIKRYVAGIMLEISIGYTPSSGDDAYIEMVEEAMHLTLEVSGPSSALVDFFPLLKYLPSWLPGMEFKRMGMKARPLIYAMEHIPLERVKKEMAAGNARPCLAKTLLEEAKLSGTLNAESEQGIARALGILYAAGTDTTTSVLATFVLIMILYPEVQKKAQDEIDAVTGGSRLPKLSDRASLPYLNAMIKEIYRWLGPVPLGIPHQLTENDVYRGYEIPKGSMIITNIWGMLHDGALYEDPGIFNPDRFMSTTLEAHDDTIDPRTMIFGFGRRICPGRFLADSTIFLAVAGIIAAFDIRPAKTAEGKDILPEVSFVSGVVRHPQPFLYDVQPRSAATAELVLSSA